MSEVRLSGEDHLRMLEDRHSASVHSVKEAHAEFELAALSHLKGDALGQGTVAFRRQRNYVQ
jgi:hypothetical protein